MSLEQVILTAMCVPHGDPRNDETKWGLPLILWGDPGIGKSDRVVAVAEFMRFFTALVFPSTCAPEDFSGIPVPDKNGGIVRLCPMEDVRELVGYGEGVLFIDELTTVGARVQAALMGVVLNRRMGDLKLPPKIRPILAANPPESSTGGHDASTALANRCCHITVRKPSVEEWIEWNFDKEIGRKTLPDSMKDAEDKVKADWEMNWAQARSLVCGFLQGKGMEGLYKLPEVGSPQRNRAYQTHRTWFYVENAIATARALKVSDDVEDEIIEGCVGDGICSEFRTWRKESDLPSPQDMLAKGFQPDNKRLDRSLYAYSALCGYVAAMASGQEKFSAGGKAYTMLKQGIDAGLGDLLYRPSAELVNSGLMPSTLKTQEHIKAATAVMAKFKDKSEALRAAFGDQK